MQRLSRPARSGGTRLLSGCAAVALSLAGAGCIFTVGSTDSDSSTSSSSTTSADSGSTMATSTSDPGTDTEVATGTETDTGGASCEMSGCFKNFVVDADGGVELPVCGVNQWSCELPEACGGALSYSVEGGIGVESGTCAVNTLSGDSPATIHLYYVDEAIDISIFVIGDGTALMQWTWDAGDLLGSAYSERLTLVDDAYFDDCLSGPTSASLVTCLIGDQIFGETETWTPAWAIETCDAMVPAGCTRG